ncbi:MAG: NAD(P)-binding domain-containing protein [Turneriella sp.]
MLAFLGTGLLGSGFVRAVLRRGDQVVVYNRTLEKAAALGKEGAQVFPLAADAVKNAAAVHLVLSDDTAVEAVIKDILPALPKETPLFDHTTTSIEGACRRTADLGAIGVTYQHAPVFMSPQNALDAAGVMLISGERSRYEKYRGHLEPMTGKLVYLGDDIGRAAAMKLGGNLMLMAITAGLTDMARFLKGADVPREAINHLFESFNPGLSVQPRAKRMFSGEYENPSWELKMARKDARLILEEAGKNNLPLKFVPAIAAEMDRFIAAGNGERDWTVLGSELL